MTVFERLPFDGDTVASRYAEQLYGELIGVAGSLTVWTAIDTAVSSLEHPDIVGLQKPLSAIGEQNMMYAVGPSSSDPTWLEFNVGPRMHSLPLRKAVRILLESEAGNET